ncbi:hypothetical protein ACFLT5_03235 [Chloroflexota bacterium]
MGCERSGTSAVSTLLKVGSGWTLLDDPVESWYIYPMVFRVGYGMPLKFWLKLRKHRIVKVPGFATILPYLRRRYLGDFTAVYCLRDPRDVVASILERMEQGYTPLFTDVTWLGIRVRDPVEALAWRWRRYLESMMAYRADKGSVVILRYEGFCSDKQGTLEEVAQAVRMPFSGDRVLSMLDRQFRKGWSDTIAGPGRWRRDLDSGSVRSIEGICGTLMNRWDYDLGDYN